MSEEESALGHKIPFLEHIPEDMANILIQRFIVERPDFMESLAARLLREDDLVDLMKIFSLEIERYGLDTGKYDPLSLFHGLTKLARSAR